MTMERSKTVHQHHNTTTVLSFTRAQDMVSHTVMHYRIGVCTWPTNIVERSKTFNSSSYFLCAWFVYIAHTFFSFYWWERWWDANAETMHQQLLQLVSIIQELWITEEKLRFVKSIRHLKRTNKKVGWRCASYKNRYKLFLSRASNVLTEWLTWCGRTLTYPGTWCIIR